MKKILLILLAVCVGIGTSLAAEKKIPAKKIAEEIPDLHDATCTFMQERKVSGAVFVSGGNFQFIKDKGVVFETLYPVQMVSSYASSRNKQINDIILAVADKDTSYLEKNFNVNFSKEEDDWALILTPKNSDIKAHLNTVSIKGKSDIEQITIDTVRSGVTDILFKCGS